MLNLGIVKSPLLFCVATNDAIGTLCRSWHRNILVAIGE